MMRPGPTAPPRRYRRPHRPAATIHALAFSGPGADTIGPVCPIPLHIYRGSGGVSGRAARPVGRRDRQGGSPRPGAGVWGGEAPTGPPSVAGLLFLDNGWSQF